MTEPSGAAAADRRRAGSSEVATHSAEELSAWLEDA